MLTKEELAQLAAAGSLEELEALLVGFLEAGKITEDQATAYFYQFTAPEGTAETPPAAAPPGGQGRTGIPQIGAPDSLEYLLGLKKPALNQTSTYRPPNPLNLAAIFGKGYERLLSPVDRFIYQLIHQDDAPAVSVSEVPPTEPTASTSPLDQYLNDPEIKAYLGAYTSEPDLANRISNLIAQGILPDEATAGSIYNRILGITASRKDLETAEANLAFAPDSPEYQKALADAQRDYQADQAKIDRQAGMFIRAGTKRGETATAKAAAKQRAERIAGINYVNKLNAGVQADYEEELARVQADFEERKARQEREEAEVTGRTPEWEQYAKTVTALAQAEEATRKQREARFAPGRTPEEEARIQREPWLSDFTPVPSEAIPAQPSYESAYEPFLATLGAPRLREFIRSKLGGIAQETAGARAEWWKRKNAPQDVTGAFGELTGESFGDVIARLRGESSRLGGLLQSEGIAPTMGGVPTTTGPAWGWQQRQNEMNAKLAELYGMGEQGFTDYGLRRMVPPAKEEDPFLTEIKRRYGDKLGFMAEWMSKAPEERGYQRQRYAPRISRRI